MRVAIGCGYTMVHTLSGIVLHRLWRMQAASDTPTEARAVIGAMVERVREVDPQYFDRFGTDPLDESELPEWRTPHADGTAQAAEFDARLGSLSSKLLDYPAAAPRVLAEAYRAVTGVVEAGVRMRRRLTGCSTARKLYRLRRGTSACTPLMRPLQHANFTFAKKTATADKATSGIAWCRGASAAGVDRAPVSSRRC